MQALQLPIQSFVISTTPFYWITVKCRKFQNLESKLAWGGLLNPNRKTLKKLKKKALQSLQMIAYECANMNKHESTTTTTTNCKCFEVRFYKSQAQIRL